MKLALVGKSIAHSRSPELYKKLINNSLAYDLIDIQLESDLPDLINLSTSYNGINITSPYKRSYFPLVQVGLMEAIELGAINTISFNRRGWFGTNTDVYAVEKILRKMMEDFSRLNLIILGSGVMGQLTSIIAKKLKLNHTVIDRSQGLNSHMSLLPYDRVDSQNVVINACSRSFIFEGEISKTTIFWDYNYDFSPHMTSLPPKVAFYMDGQEMLALQAEEASRFFEEHGDNNDIGT